MSTVEAARPRIALICHADDELALDGLTRWLGSFSNFCGLVVVQEPPSRKRRRIRRELRRVGPLRFLDVLAYRVVHRLHYAAGDRHWHTQMRDELRRRYPESHGAPVMVTATAASPEVQAFLTDLAPDIVLARYKSLLPERVFSIPRLGTFVMHPGICPEYRNAHGGFWAMARRDLGRVGVTLLRIDPGIDTGPVFGYYRAPFDERRESHLVIQERCLFENLDAVAQRLVEIQAGTARPISTEGHESAEWGQPWLSAYLAWQRAARRTGATA